MNFEITEILLGESKKKNNSCIYTVFRLNLKSRVVIKLCVPSDNNFLKIIYKTI